MSELRMILCNGEGWAVRLGNAVGAGFSDEGAESGVTHRFLRFTRGKQRRQIRVPLDYTLDDEGDLCVKLRDAT